MLPNRKSVPCVLCVCVSVVPTHVFSSNRPRVGAETQTLQKHSAGNSSKKKQKNKNTFNLAFFPHFKWNHLNLATADQTVQPTRTSGEGEDGKLFQLCIWNNKDLLATRVLNLFVFCFVLVASALLRPRRAIGFWFSQESRVYTLIHTPHPLAQTSTINSNSRRRDSKCKFTH